MLWGDSLLTKLGKVARLWGFEVRCQGGDFLVGSFKLCNMLVETVAVWVCVLAARTGTALASMPVFTEQTFS